jgi:two-component system nitrogen regulation response regulator GlnG
MARLMQTDLTVMIAGESGTGKELVARALHDFGRRKDGSVRRHQHGRHPARSDRVGAVRPREGRLHRRVRTPPASSSRRRAARCSSTRSATCRWRRRRGCCACCSRASTPPSAAACRSSADVRIVAATHQDLRELINQGLFREDLFYRLNVVPMRLPPLRERAEDIPDLARSFPAPRRAGGPAGQDHQPERRRPPARA